MLEALMNFEAMVEQLKEEKKNLGISNSTGLKTALELLIRKHPELTRYALREPILALEKLLLYSSSLSSLPSPSVLSL